MRLTVTGDGEGRQSAGRCAGCRLSVSNGKNVWDYHLIKEECRMKLEIQKAVPADVEELERLYDGLNDYLQSHTNYPGWIKGVYPVREDAEKGIREGCLFVARAGCRIAGTVILNHTPEEAYQKADWKNGLEDKDICFVHTLAVHPDHLHQGTGRQLMEFSLSYAGGQNCKAVRLATYEKNMPAVRLYESLGFQYMGKADLGYGKYGLDWYRLYQKILS